MTPVFVALLLAQGTKKPPPVDVWSPPTPRVFAAWNGQFAFKVLPTEQGTKAIGYLFSVDGDGSEHEIWKRALECVPVEVYVSDAGQVATIDEWGGRGKKHSLVTYDAKGKTTSDRSLRDLFPRMDPKREAFILQTPSSFQWMIQAQAGFYIPGNTRFSPVGLFDQDLKTGGRQVFWIKTFWGDLLRFDPDTGKELDRKQV
ncbi:hypothetical protein [Fimbriimonas ginsengisoli]|uniref:Uncharacterized protein n=1 Tax=Fimbriimonas ginsengisoli Gsoil 348 TaxID=661478 RepID=A0A068NPE5_FIMGI|nr:hypothetical protein [Fimbriimonas ginsengisoli]AIE85321.1 hypothetical protein OP10G_1953 [Fimbriimonas ginsengisoli Gsoil 348]